MAMNVACSTNPAKFEQQLPELTWIFRLPAAGRWGDKPFFPLLCRLIMVPQQSGMLLAKKGIVPSAKAVSPQARRDGINA
jgi:hypothetical protein